MSSKLHKLRIAFSVVCGIVCLLLVVLWVRSYWWSDYFHVPLPIPNVLTVHSMYGTTDWYLKSSKFSRIWTIESNTVAREMEGIAGPNPWLRQLFFFRLHRRVLSFPHWVLVLLFAIFAVAPWLRFRFSLRTLLIATTLVAVVLGLMVWAVRS